MDRISDFLFSRVFCDGWVIIASFSWRQRRHYFVSCCKRLLILVFPQVMVGETFMSFRFHICVDKEVLVK